MRLLTELQFCPTSSKNPECESVQDFYFFHFLLFTKIRIRDLLK